MPAVIALLFLPDVAFAGTLDKGKINNTTSDYSVAIGYGAVVNGEWSVPGWGASEATAVGSYATTSGNFANAFGTRAQALAKKSTALGHGTKAAGISSLSVGSDVASSADGVVAVGSDTTASGIRAIAVGAYVEASAERAIAMGSGAAARQAGSVALGAGAVTSAVTATQSALIAGQLYQFAGAAPTSTVSVGAAGTERTITNVAAGRLSAESTDAVNGSQLHAANQAIAALGSSVASNTTRITQMVDQIGSGTVGSVQQDAATSNVSVAKDKGGTQVSFAGTAGNRGLTGVANSAVGAGSSEGINGAQLYGTNKSVADALGGSATLNADGTITGPAYTVANKTVSSVGAAISNLDGRVANLGDRLASSVTYVPGSIDAGAPRVELAPGTGDSRYFADTNGDGVGERDAPLPKGTRISNVADGIQDTDAVNLGQLRDRANATFDSRSRTYGPPTPAPLRATPRMFAAEVVELRSGGRAVDSRARQRTTAMRDRNYYLKVNGRSDASGSTGPTDEAIGNGIGGIAIGSDSGITADNAIAIGALARTTARDAVALGTGSVADQDNTVSVGSAMASSFEAYANDGLSRTRLTSAANTRRIVNMAAGLGDTDAVNVGQLKQVTQALGGGAGVNSDGSITGPSYVFNGKSINSVGDALTEVDGRISQVDQRVTQLGDQLSSRAGVAYASVKSDKPGASATGKDSIAVGPGAMASGEFAVASGPAAQATGAFAVAMGEKAVASTWGGVALGAQSVADRGNAVSVGSASVKRQIINVAKGSAESDAATVGQLNNATQFFRARSDKLHAHATGADSIGIGPEAIASSDFSISVGSASQATARYAVALGEKATAATWGAVALGAQSIADRDNAVSLGSNTLKRQITNMRAGTAATDAVNVSQLQGAVDAFGGGARINPDGTLTGPSYDFGDKRVSSVGDALSDIASRVAKLGDAVNSISNAGNAGNPGSAAGVPPMSASMHNPVTLRASVSSTEPQTALSSSTYTANGEQVGNVGDALSNIDGRVISNTAAIANLTSGGGVKYLSVKSSGAAASAMGTDAVAAGPQSSATGAAAVAIGNGAQASADNSVALGAGSVATKSNSVSVGSAGKERSISHVAAGNDDTDAVNLSQLRKAQAGTVQYDRPSPGAAPDMRSLSLGGPNGSGTTVRNVSDGVAPMDAVNVRQLQSGMADAVGQSRAYTDQRVQSLSNDVWDLRRESRAGTASAIAMAGLVQAYEAGDSLMSVGMGSFQGEYSMAVGLSGVSGSGRHLYKAQASTNTRKDLGFSVAAGWRW